MRPSTTRAAAATATTPPPMSSHSRESPRLSLCAVPADGDPVPMGPRVLAVGEGTGGAAPCVLSPSVGVGLLAGAGASMVICFSADPAGRPAAPTKVATSFPSPTAAVSGIST